MSICEFCGGEYKNVAVHQRFCKAKKEALERGEKLSDEEKNTIAKNSIPIQEAIEEGSDFVEKPLEAEVTKEQVQLVQEKLDAIDEKQEEQETISEDITATVLDGSIPEDDTPTEEQLEETLKEVMNDPEVVKVKEGAIERQAEPIQEQVDLVSETSEFPNNDQLKVMFKNELAIEFNEPKDSWEEKLANIFKQVDPGKEIHIKLKGQLSHEFSDIFGVYRYPSDMFINLIRNYCSSFRDEVNNQGGQTFICRRK